MIKFDFEDGVQFDPGFVGHLTAFVPNIEYVYADINRYKVFNQKKQKFKTYYPKIQKLMEDYIGFYLGCILWAVCVKEEKTPLLNNLCFGGEYSEGDTLEEVIFVQNYFNQLKKDVKYYLGVDYAPNELQLKIVDEYKEFLALNKGFVEVNSASDILVNSSVKSLSKADKELILEQIAEVVENGNFASFYPLNEKIFG